MMRAAWLIAMCACSEHRLLLEVATPDGPMTASTLEVILAEPTITARDNQRTNTRDAITFVPDTETVYYLAQRTRLDYELDGRTPIGGFEVQLAVQDLATYVPIVVARGAQGEIVGLGGVLDSENPTTLRAADYIYDVTHYTVDVEPVTPPTINGSAAVPVVIMEGQVLVVGCDQMGTSGYAWRPQPRADLVRPQLRILLPFDRPDGDALERLVGGPDLDCDRHTPRNRVDKGDELDCDDTTQIVFAGPPPEHELCDHIDNDCNENTFGATVMAAICPTGTCSGKAITCTEDVGPFVGGDALCPQGQDCPHCQIFSRDPMTDPEKEGCQNTLTWALPGECQSSCVLRLVDVDPRWDVRIGSPGTPDKGLFEIHRPLGQPLEIAIQPHGGATFAANDNAGGSFVLMMRTTPTATPRMIDLAIEMPSGKRVPDCQSNPLPASLCQ